MKNLPDEESPKALKVSPLSATPHKSRGWRAILDLSWVLKWLGGELDSVNATSTKRAPRGAIDQIGHALYRIIYAIASAPDGKKVYLAKWDIKDGFWQMVAARGAEWNFCYVLPQETGAPIRIVKPTSLQMGWIESPPFFGVASETARDVAQVYAQAPLGALPPHKFEHYAQSHRDFKELPEVSPEVDQMQFSLEVYVDDFIGLVAASSQQELTHVARAVMHGMHDVFPAKRKEEDDLNSVKKLKKGDGAFVLENDALGFDFDGGERTLILGEAKRDALLATLREWKRLARRRDRKRKPAG